MKVSSIGYEECKLKAFNEPLFKTEKLDFNNYFTTTLVKKRYPSKEDLNAERRISFEKFETYILLILAFSILWRHRFKATEALRGIYKKI